MTNIERTILRNQYKILSLLDKSNAHIHEERREILDSGFEGLYDDVLVSNEFTSKKICLETFDILDMNRSINRAIDSLDDETKKELDLKKIAFEGFDGNHDDHYGFAKFLLEKKDLYTSELDNIKSLNSHDMTSIDKYRMMLLIRQELRDADIYRYGKEELELFIKSV